jgi:hypothetical protein
MPAPTTPQIGPSANADRWIVTSAVVVGGTFALLKWKGKTQTTVGTFATAWGTVYLVLALAAEASPQFGGAFALLVMVGDLLANAPALSSLVSSNAFGGSSSVAPGTGAGSALKGAAGSAAGSVLGGTGGLSAGGAGVAAGVGEVAPMLPSEPYVLPQAPPTVSNAGHGAVA